MPEPIGVSPAKLHELSGEIQQGAVAIEVILAELGRKIEPLLAEWTGEAQQSFDDLWSQWQAGAEHVQQALVAIAELIAKAGLAYAEAERSIAAAFQL